MDDLAWLASATHGRSSEPNASKPSLTSSLEHLSLSAPAASGPEGVDGVTEITLSTPRDHAAILPRAPSTEPGDSTSASRFQHLFAGAPHTSKVDALAPAPEDARFAPHTASTAELPGSTSFSGVSRPSPPGFYPSSWNAAASTTAPFSLTVEPPSIPQVNAPSLSLFSGPLRLNAPGSPATAPPGPAAPAAPTGEADIIPTAIVIKNIPFNTKREQLLHIIRDLGVPVPYAFNYHFDQGIFRGLAFANFHSPAEANEVVNALNGLDVSGRKLRVEYKKVLQAGEKERIEKEKAMKRMQFSQWPDKDRKKDKGLTLEIPPFSGFSGAATSPARSSTNVRRDSGLRTPDAHPQAGLARSPGDAQSEQLLDLNDAATLEIYSRALLFKDDRMRDELAFSKSLTPAERRVVHLVAQKLNLFHYTVGSNDDRHVLVTKTEAPCNNAPPSLLDPSEAMPPMSFRAAPGSLLNKKSTPDMKLQPRNELQRSSTPNIQSPSLLVPPQGSYLMSRKSNSSLSEGYASFNVDPRFDGFSNFGTSPGTPNVFSMSVGASALGSRTPSIDSDGFDFTSPMAPSPRLAATGSARSPMRCSHSPLHRGVHPLPVAPMGHALGTMDPTVPSFPGLSSPKLEALPRMRGSGPQVPGLSTPPPFAGTSSDFFPSFNDKALPPGSPGPSVLSPTHSQSTTTTSAINDKP